MNVKQVKYWILICFYYSPPDPSTLQQAREKRLKDLKTNSALKEILAFFVFLILLIDVAQYHRTPETFLLTKTLYETFEEVDAYGLDFAVVSNGIYASAISRHQNPNNSLLGY